MRSRELADPDEGSWAETLAVEVQQAACRAEGSVSRVVVRAPAAVEVWFRYCGDSAQRAVRVSRPDFESAELLEPDGDPETLASYVVVLAVEEPHSDADFEADDRGVLWLRPSAWVM